MARTKTRLTEATVIRALAALAQPMRLRAFRELIAAGSEGLAAGAIAETLQATPSALSFHLKELTHAGLIAAESRGRFLIYRANFREMQSLVDYLTEHCCQGEACEVKTPRGCRAC
jgi:DNA-binding transcriptional ArsR family regulator